MELVDAAADNPLHEDDIKGDSDAVIAPHLLLVQIYGGKLMQLGPFMPPLLLAFALMNGYSRNEEYMPWEQEARCRVDSNTEFFKACEENHPWDHCQTNPSFLRAPRGLFRPSSLGSMHRRSVHRRKAQGGTDHSGRRW